MIRLTFSFILTIFVAHATALIYPIPQNIEYNIQKAKLGKKLFFETKLSKNNTISCASCHFLTDGGDDNIKFSFGIDGKMGNINSPTVLNSVYNFRQFWNGRSKTLKEQALGPIENPVEMGHSFNILVKELKKDTAYPKKFSEFYPDGITRNNIADAIAEFEKTLITPNAPFDKYLRGDENAVSENVKKGYKLFEDKGCIGCHNGVNIGGSAFAKFGVIKGTDSTHKGLYELTKDKDDLYIFKVPTLRNITKTAPYFHDGRSKNLYDSIDFMANIQLGITLKDEEILLIEEFLKSLDGELKIIDD